MVCIIASSIQKIASLTFDMVRFGDHRVPCPPQDSRRLCNRAGCFSLSLSLTRARALFLSLALALALSLSLHLSISLARSLFLSLCLSFSLSVSLSRTQALSPSCVVIRLRLFREGSLTGHAQFGERRAIQIFCPSVSQTCVKKTYSMAGQDRDDGGKTVARQVAAGYEPPIHVAAGFDLLNH